MSESFPRQYARTQRFTLGEPRNVEVSPDGERIVFLRSNAGDDPVNALWVFDVPTGEERLVADPRTLLGMDDPGAGDVTDEERAASRADPGRVDRHHVVRDGSRGAGHRLRPERRVVHRWAAEWSGPSPGGRGSGARPRPDPTASRLAYVSGATLRVAELDGSSRVLAGNDRKDGDSVSWGSADFVAAEEMHRFRGYWWNPDGSAIAVCRVDDGPVPEWTIADPADPSRPARTVRYPAAGTENPIVTLHVIGLDGSRLDVDWDREFFPYLAHVEWTEDGLLMSVQSRDQRGSMAMTVDLDTGEAIALTSDYDDAWIENVPGVPRLLPGGALLTASDRDGMRRLYVDDRPVTPVDLQVRSVVCVADPDENDEPDIVFLANDPDEPTDLHVWSTTATTDPDAGVSELGRLTEAPGLHGVAVGGATIVARSVSLDRPGARYIVLVDGLFDGPELASHAETPTITPNVTLLRTGERELATAVLLPTGRDPDDDAPLPVLLDPYGGPHAQRVTSSFNAYLSPQWFADQGFVVIVADGRGTPGRGPAWEREVHRDLANPPLEDQIDALHASAERYPAIDLDRVAIRGWSFGGYLAALAVLRRPDTFHAAIAGAPVTEWRLYDTHYTERYLGDPDIDDGADVYDANSLLPLAAQLERPLLLIHGLADDNVVAAHTLRLSSALLAAGRAHEVLPLVGVTHMTPQEVVAENILRHQLDFLSRALGSDLESSSR